MEGSVNFITAEMADAVSKTNGGTFGGNVIVDKKDGTASTEGFSYFKVGNATPAGTNQNSTGLIELYSESEYSARLYADPLTQQRYIGLPDKNGTVALTSDIAKTQQDYSDVSVAANSSTWVANVRMTTESLANITTWVDNSNCIAYIALANQSLQLYVRNFSSSAITVNVTVVIS